VNNSDFILMRVLLREPRKMAASTAEQAASFAMRQAAALIRMKSELFTRSTASDKSTL
jgi:hypothetical protein